MIEAPVSSFDTGAAIEIRGSTDALRHALERDALAEQPATAIGKIRRIERRIGGPRETRAKGHRRPHLTFSVGTFGQAVGVKYQHVAGIEHNSPLLVANVVVNAEGKPDQVHLFAAAALPEQRLRLPSVGDAHLAPAFLPGGEAQRNEAAFNA